MRVRETGQFLKELKKCRKRGKDIEKLYAIVELLENMEDLPAKYRLHKLKGDYAGFWECHIEPDWLLIYEMTDEAVILTRTGTHSDLFG